MTTLTIQELEGAINYFREQDPPQDNCLSPRLRKLADLYGVMAYQKLPMVKVDQLTPDQVAILATVPASVKHRAALAAGEGS